MPAHLRATAVRAALRRQATAARAEAVARFFKTGPGEYGEGDRFIGVTVPAQRAIARQFSELPLNEADALLTSPIHEERLTALLILVGQYTRSDDRRGQIYRLYMQRLQYINNWDLVDTSAAPIVGAWLDARRAASSRATSPDILMRLARSPRLWSRRIAMIATSHFIVRGEYADAIRIATVLVDDEHDLIQKAVGWMLREVGKRASLDALRAFLSAHAATMPRTTLRYAIERLPERERARWMRCRSATSNGVGRRR